MAKGDRWSDNQNVQVREMRNADTVLGVSLRTMPRGHSSRAAETASVPDIGPLESCLRSKDSRAVRRGAVGKVPQGNSLAAYSTARTVPGGGEPPAREAPTR